MNENSWTISTSEKINKLIVKETNTLLSQFKVSTKILFYFFLVLVAFLVFAILLTFALNSSISKSDKSFEVGHLWWFEISGSTWSVQYTNYQYALIINGVLIIIFLFFSSTYLFHDLKKAKVNIFQKDLLKISYFIFSYLFTIVYVIVVILELTDVPKFINPAEVKATPSSVPLGIFWLLENVDSINSISAVPTSTNIVISILIWLNLLILVSAILFITLRKKEQKRQNKTDQ